MEKAVTMNSACIPRTRIPLWALATSLVGNKLKHYFGIKYNHMQQKSNQKIIQMKKKTYRKVEWDKTISSSTEFTNAGSKNKVVKETKPIKKLTRYMKIGGSGSGSTRTKISTKPSSASRPESHTSFMNNTTFLKQRRGSTMTTWSNNTSRYWSADESKQKFMGSKDSIKTPNSVKKPKETHSKTSYLGNTDLLDKSGKSGDLFLKSNSKWSLPGNLTKKFSNSSVQVASDIDEWKTQNDNYNRLTYFSNNDSNTIRAPHLMSAGSIASQSSEGTSTLSTIHGLNEINKVILSKNINPRKELLNNRDNKVYSYKLNQLISIIKSSQSNANKKTVKKV